MRPGILHPNYVYRPASDRARARMSVSQRRRLGIPDGYVRIYDVHILAERAEPLRTYAADVARLRGYQAANAFVLSAVASNHEPERPFPARVRAFGPYLPPREFVRLRLLRRFVRSFHITVQIISGTYAKKLRSGTGKPKYDWELVAALLEDGATIEEVRVLFGASPTSFRYAAIKRGLVHPLRRLRRRDG